MTDGSAPPAESPPNSSTSTPTGSPWIALGTQEVFPVMGETLTALLIEAFETGWKCARQVPGNPLPLAFDLKVNHETRQVEAFARLL